MIYDVVHYMLWLTLGSMWGLLMGVIPVAGVTTALIAVYGLTGYFLHDPYTGIVFMTAVVASCASGDSITSIISGIPGSSSTAACMIDGYPMSQRGEAARALSIATFDSMFNGILWGLLAFGLLPFYSKVVLLFGIPEFAGFMILSLACVGFVTSKNAWKSIFAIALGAIIGMIGQDPGTAAPRMTFGWDYLEAGIQTMPFVAGLFGIPEIIEGWRYRNNRPAAINDYWGQTWQGMRDCIEHWRDMLRGGSIGFFTGLLPGVGGNVGDILAYGATVASHPNDTFGNGNPKGLLGCEGANNAQKASSLIPALLFGIPAAPFAAIMMAMCMNMGMEMGTTQLLNDTKFVWSIGSSFVLSTLLVFTVCLFFNQAIIQVLHIPYWIFATAILAVIVWSCLEYTGTINDIYILILCSLVGIACKHFEISRPAVLITYTVVERLESYLKQTSKLYSVSDLLTRPLFLAAIIAAVGMMIYSIRNQKKGIEYV
jgi:putative tricarboxylic transport membrane protein